MGSERGRSQSIGSTGDNSGGENRAYNKFAALDDDEDGMENAAVTNPAPPKGNSRSEALRQGLGPRASSKGGPSSGRRLADLAATAPEQAAATRGYSGRYSSRSNGNSAAPPVDEGKVIRFTRERLLSMRPAPSNSPPEVLTPLVGNVIISELPQDPVCWDNFDAEEIWAAVPRRASAKAGPASGRSLSDIADGAPPGRSRREMGSTSGRWQRGVALPPPSAADKARKDRDAENPNDLWDDPISGGPAGDFSAFGDMGNDEDDAGAFDFEKMAEQSRMLEEELHGGSRSRTPSEGTEADGDDELPAVKSIDPHRPLASVGTTIKSGSGDDVNVFEDFDEPGSSDSTPTAVDPTAAKTEPNNPSIGAKDSDATSRLMAMIGVSAEPDSKADSGSAAPKTDSALSDAWGLPGASTSEKTADGLNIPLNPWGGPLLGASDSVGGAGLLQPSSDEAVAGLDLQARLREAEIQQQKAREAEEMERRRQQELEAQKQAASMQQQQQNAQRQQQAGVQNQVELVLMERISNILENSWGRSDLVSVLSTLHAEDSRVIPLLNSIEALRGLIMRHSTRVSLRQDPAFGAEMAVLLLTNAQWQQQQQEAQQQQARQEAMLRAKQEEERAIRERQEQQRREEAARNQSKPIVPGAPWYYSDPQQNIQGPFRGEEMRQWLEAGYFKGDLPVSQDPTGPFRPLSVNYPDLSKAFMDPADTADQEEEKRKAAEQAERQRLEEEAKARKVAEAQERERMERIAKENQERELAAERERQAAEEAARGNQQESAAAVNESSNQLKMMLGLSAEQQAQQQASIEQPKTDASPKKSAKSKKSSAPKVQAPAAPAAQSTPKPAASAWGSTTKQVSKKSMSEIQREEARIAALQAAERQRTGSGGWANIAASKGGPTAAKGGPGGWSNGAAKLTPAAVVTKPTQVLQKPKPANAAGRARSVPGASASQTNAASKSAAEDFGAKMSPTLEKWCKEQMMKINGSDDLTLVSFCMSLNDPSEIRQYLVTYLGPSPQVNNFANEFIQRKVGVKPVKEEWETTVSGKKKSKKKR